MFDVGGGELILILLAIIVLFGPKKLPEIAQMFGKGMAHLRKAQSDLQSQLSDIKQEVESQINVVQKEVESIPKATQIRQPLPDYAATDFSKMKEENPHQKDDRISKDLSDKLNDNEVIPLNQKRDQLHLEVEKSNSVENEPDIANDKSNNDNGIDNVTNQ